MRRLVATVALAAAVATGCSASHHTSPSATQPANVPAATGAAGATAWWTASDYCGMLRQTLKAGHSVLPGVSASDPGYAKVTTTFITALQRAAPHEVAGAWQVLGNLIVSLVHPGTGTTPAGAEAAKIKSAVATVSADAKTRCGLNLSASAN